LNTVRLFRKRYIPNELIELTKDQILHIDDKLIVTRWEAIRPRSDMLGGISYYFLQEGYKISKIYDHNYTMLHWYCDIIDMEYRAHDNAYICNDLLVDVVVSLDQSVKILDLEEIADALDVGIITEEDVKKALRRLHCLLEIIYNNQFPPEEVNRHRVEIC
jgi:predicted RNA-binding protein associated with RNAse of E/G family